MLPKRAIGCSLRCSLRTDVISCEMIQRKMVECGKKVTFFSFVGAAQLMELVVQGVLPTTLSFQCALVKEQTHISPAVDVMCAISLHHFDNF